MTGLKFIPRFSSLYLKASTIQTEKKGSFEEAFSIR